MYISLHNRSAFSFGSALTVPQQLANFARRCGMPAIALTDLDGLYAAVPFAQACGRAGVKPILGVELQLESGAAVTLLARTQRGYANLCRLVSRRHLKRRPLTAVDLCGHAEGLIALIGATPDEPALQMLCGNLREAFHERLYVELAVHRAADAGVVRRRAALADRCGLPVAASSESRCVERRQGPLLQALASVGTLTLLDQPHPLKVGGAWHLRKPSEMHALFARRPDALDNTRHIAEQCDFAFDLTQNRFPSYASPDGRSAVQHLRELCLAGCRRRYLEEPPPRGLGGHRPAWSEVMRRLERELSIIEEVHYAEYFLVFHEIVDFCHRRNIDTLARGSAADSLVCYALGVSHACPFRFDLPFDRFINAQRARFSKLADIDLDLPWDRRDEVLRWVYRRWGEDRVAMIGCANTYQVRAAVVELGKVFGLPPHEVHQATRRMRRMRARNLAQAIAAVPEARDLPLAEEPYRTILGMAGGLSGLPRHWSMHPCGVVVSPEPLTGLVPVQRSPKGFVVAQYDMDAIEELGFIKIDLLGQAGLSVLRDTVADIQRTEGRRVDLTTEVDYSEPETWDMIAGGRARGVHHIESPAMTSLLQQCNCRDIDCLTAVVAIIRPGAANQGKKEQFARRYQGFEKPSFAHPVVEPILKGTFGLMVFEEHILQIATEFAGLDLGAADVLRRGLNKQDAALIRDMKRQFAAEARRRGRDAGEIDTVWTLLEGFSGFMFNKAHSAEYAVEAFQGAWLKRRWPAHYIAAILSNYRGFYAHSPTLPQILYVMEALRLGIGFLPPCVNRSLPRFAVERGPVRNGGRPMIRLPVSHINGLSQSFIERHLEARAQGPFAGVEGFLQRCRPAPSEAQLLLDSGALDALGPSRPQLFWHLRTRVGHPAECQGLLWDQERDRSASAPPLRLCAPDPRHIARREMELLGFPITIDPLTYLGGDDKGRSIDWTRYLEVDRLGEHLGKQVQVCGLTVADRINPTQDSGELMKFVTLADRSGFIEAILFPDVYRRFGYLTAAHPILSASGVVEPFENRRGCTLRVQRVAVPAAGR